MSRLTIQLLGPPRIEIDGTLIEVDTRKAIALLAYLVVARHAQSRDVLATLLWEEYDQSSARAALRRTLSALKGALKGALTGGWLEVDRDTVRLPDREGLVVDVWRFQNDLRQVRDHGHGALPCRSCLQVLENATTLYRGDFLSGFSIRDSERFEEWQLLQTEELRRNLAEALDRLSRGHAAGGQLEQAIGAARRRLALDPLHEPAHAQLMRLYHESGQRSAALRQYRECVAVLERELAVAPLEETTQLYQAIKENHEPVRRVVSSEAPAQRPSPLVGREGELDTLMSAYSEIRGTGHVILLEGEAGIGKTRLAEEFLQSVRAAGGKTLVARSYEGEANLAYAPFIEVLRGAVRMLDRDGGLSAVPAPLLAEASRLLPDLLSLRPDLPAPAPLDNPGAQSWFLEGVSELLIAALRGERVGVLAIEDLQWADHASLDLLAALIRRLHDTPVCLLITWRGEQMPLSHWLRRRLIDLQRAQGATILALRRLDETTVLRLVRAALNEAGEERATELGRRLYEETEGLPLFLDAYLAALDARAPGGEWPLPGGVRELLQARLAGTSEIGWQVLSAGASIGRSFDFDTVRVASGRDEEMVIGALEELMTAGLIAEIEGGSAAPTYDFNHEKLRTLVYEETSLARRRLLHRRIAEALMQRSRGRDTGAGQIAAHYRLAGDDATAAEYYRQAGNHARSLYANREALRDFQTAIALGHPDGPALHQSIGDAQTLLAEYGGAIRSYETAAALSEGPELARIEHKLGLVYQRTGDWDLAASHLEAALDNLGEEGAPAERARLYADRSLVAYRRGEPDCAHDLAERALVVAEEAEDIQALAQAHNILGILANARGERAEARAHLERSLAFAEQLDNRAARAAASNNLALVAREEGDLERSRMLTESALDIAVSQGDRHREAALHNNLADLLHLAGRGDEAIAHVKAAVTIYAEIGVEAGTVRPEIWKLTEW